MCKAMFGMMLGFSPTGAWAIVLYVIGVLVLFGTFVGQQLAAFSWVRERFFRRDTDEALPPVLLLPHGPDTAEQSALANPRMVEITPTGGSSGDVDFRVEVANYGARQCRCRVEAHVAGAAVQCIPQTVDLIPNQPPQRVRVLVPRPHLGDLVPGLNNETTLYGEPLRIELICDKQVATREWREKLYDAATERARHEIQQRAWRFGRGEDTPADRRADYLDERERRIARGERDSSPYEEL